MSGKRTSPRLQHKRAHEDDEEVNHELTSDEEVVENGAAAGGSGGTGGGKRKVSKSTNDSSQLHFTNRFSDYKPQSLPKGSKAVPLSEDWKRFFSEAQDAGLVVACTSCLWSKEPQDLSLTKGFEMHLLCPTPFKVKNRGNVVTELAWLTSMNSEEWHRFAAAAVRKWENDVTVAKDETVFRRYYAEAGASVDTMSAWLQQWDPVKQNGHRVVHGKKVSVANIRDDDDELNGVGGIGGIGELSGGAGTSMEVEGPELLAAATKLSAIIKFLDRAVQAKATDLQHWLDQAVAYVLTSRVLDNEYIMRTPTGTVCETARSGFLKFMGVAPADGSEPTEFVTKVVGMPKRTKITLEVALLLLREKLDELGRRQSTVDAARKARASSAAVSHSVRGSDSGLKDGSVEPTVNYVLTKFEEGNRPRMLGTGPGAIMVQTSKKGQYVKPRGCTHGLYTDAKLGPVSPLTAVRTQIPLALSGATQIHQYLLNATHILVNSFSSLPSAALKDVLIKSRIPSSAILMGGLASNRTRFHSTGPAAFAMVVQEFSMYSSATYTVREVWSRSLREIARDLATRANRGDVPVEELTDAWDEMVRLTQVDCIARVSELCTDCIDSELQVQYFQEQEEQLVPDLWDVWTAQLRMRSVMRAQLEVVREQWHTFEARRDKAEARRDRDVQAAIKQLGSAKAPAKQPFALKVTMPGAIGSGKRPGGWDRDRGRGGDQREARSASTSRSRSRSPPRRQDGGESKSDGGKGKGRGVKFAPGSQPGKPETPTQDKPQSRDNVPCRFFWGKGCRFSAAKCNFSHDVKHKPTH